MPEETAGPYRVFTGENLPLSVRETITALRRPPRDTRGPLSPKLRTSRHSAKQPRRSQFSETDRPIARQGPSFKQKVARVPAEPARSEQCPANRERQLSTGKHATKSREMQAHWGDSQAVEASNEDVMRISSVYCSARPHALSAQNLRGPSKPADRTAIHTSTRK